jgi:deoxyribodipyrimidine photolyase-related protein
MPPLQWAGDAMTTVRLVLGDQLNPNHPWFDEIRPDIVYVVMEVRQETDYVLHHAQKILAIFAAMRRFADHLRDDGHRVVYLAIDDPANRHALADNLAWILREAAATGFEYQAPDEWRLHEQLAHWSRQQAIEVRCVDSAHFLVARDAVAAHFRSQAHWTMESFYRWMRRTHGVLLNAAGGPEGGRWNFDADNRAAWCGSPAEPTDRRPHHDHGALWATIQAAGVKSFGNPASDDLRWPIDRAEALVQLDYFILEGLPHFGAYQDAMSHAAPRLFHSLLSFALNTKMLDPREVIARAEAAYRDGDAPLSSVEGFIRQILGWREYVRGVYWARMPAYVNENALAHRAPLPRWFWDGATRMRCMAHAVGQSLADAHAHHIQRLMIIGNFALLAGLDPYPVHQWYLGVYIDAFEWVEAPNTLGLSQFADGGLLATKPYVSSGAYIKRMSDYCHGCPYDPKARTGPRACPYTGLYWDFLMRHRSHLGRNPRLAMPYRQLDRMPTATREALRMHAEALRQRLDDL